MFELDRIRIEQLPDQDPDLSYLETTLDSRGRIVSSCRYSNEDFAMYGRRKVARWIDADRQRLQDYGRTWECCIIRATAQVRHTDGSPVPFSTQQYLTSGGLCGIETDSSPEYLQSVAAEEAEALRPILRDLGIPEAQISAAVAAAE